MQNQFISSMGSAHGLPWDSMLNFAHHLDRLPLLSVFDRKDQADGNLALFPTC